MAGKKDYFGLDRLVSLILAIFMPTAWILGILTRFNEGKLVAGIVRIFCGFWIGWLLDLIFMIKDEHIFRFIDM